MAIKKTISNDVQTAINALEPGTVRAKLGTFLDHIHMMAIRAGDGDTSEVMVYLNSLQDHVDGLKKHMTAA